MVEIRLLIDLPVGKEHGAYKGRVVSARGNENYKRGGVKCYFMGDQGEEVGVLKDEFEVVKMDAK